MMVSQKLLIIWAICDDLVFPYVLLLVCGSKSKFEKRDTFFGVYCFFTLQKKISLV